VTQLKFETAGNALPDDKVLDHFGCWPSDDPGANAKRKGARTIKVNADFDAVIFATGIDDFVEVFTRGKDPDTGKYFFAEMPAEWGEMSKHVRTVATQAAQVWLDRDLDQLGWHRGSGIITAFEPPFETWADMTHTLASERAWRTAKKHGKVDSDKVRSVAYFCAVLPERDVRENGEKIANNVEKNLTELLDRKIKPLWPAAFRNHHTARDFAIAHHVQANCKGSDRYTLSLPGSIEHRISPLDPSILNMAIAGDWTASGIDASCVESAVMSGMLAAFAITNDQPTLESIVGYDHP
jgi:hypothetical protein